MTEAIYEVVFAVYVLVSVEEKRRIHKFSIDEK